MSPYASNAFLNVQISIANDSFVKPNTMVVGQWVVLKIIEMFSQILVFKFLQIKYFL